MLIEVQKQYLTLHPSGQTPQKSEILALVNFTNAPGVLLACFLHAPGVLWKV